jgi:hypothetical protein
MLSARTRIPKSDYLEFSSWLQRQSIFRHAKFTPLQVGFDDLDRFIEAEPESLENELGWLVVRLSTLSPTIRGFLTTAREIEKLVWEEEGASAVEKCDALAQNYGHSLWLIKTRIGITQRFLGLENQKSFANKIKGTLGRGLAPFVTHYVGVRNEPRVTLDGFRGTVERAIERAKTTVPRKLYLTYQLLGLWPDDSLSIAHVLRTEQSHSDIDIYEAFVSALQHLAVQPKFQDLLGPLIGDIRKLAVEVEDPRLDRLLGVISSERHLPQILRLDPVWCALEQGKTFSAIRASLQRLKRDPGDVIARMGLALTAAYPVEYDSQNLETTLSLQSDLSAIFLKSPQFERSRHRLEKLCINLSTLPSYSAIGLITREESNASALSSPGWLLAALSAASASRNERLDNDKPDSSVLETTMFSDLYRASSWSATDFGEKEESILTRHFELGPRTVSVRATLLLIKLFGAQRRFGEAATVLAKSVVEHEVPTAAISSVSSFDGVTWRDLKSCRSKIEIPIALDILAAEQPNTYVSMLRFAMVEFLDQHTVDRPSLFLVGDEKPSKDYAIRFLRYASRPESLEFVQALLGSSAIERERVDICSLLQQIDPKNSRSYEDEIVSITQKQLLAEGVKLVDSTRIHVDYDAIKSQAIRDLTEDYERYRGLVTAGLAGQIDLETLMREFERIEANPGEKLSTPSSEADILFVSIISAMRTLFLSDAVHGLDAYLSRRIRHGSLIGELRGPLERVSLSTDRSESGQYAPNEYWESRFRDCSGPEAAALLEELERFVRDYDNELIRVKDRVHLKSKSIPDGLFDLPLSGVLVKLIQVGTESATSLGEVCDVAVRSFWVLLEGCLAKAREMVDNELRQRITHLLHRLQVKASTLCTTSAAHADFLRALAICAEEVRASLDTVTGWFQRADLTAMMRSYNCEQAVAIAVKSVLSAHKAFHPKVHTTHDNDQVLLSNFVTITTDVLQVAIGNAYAHSHCTNDSEIWVFTGVDRSEGLVHFVIRNNTRPSARTHVSLVKLEEIRRQIQAGDFLKDIPREGRSGLKKLAGTFGRRLNGRLAFDFDSSGDFVLEVDVPIVSLES